MRLIIIALEAIKRGRRDKGTERKDVRRRSSSLEEKASGVGCSKPGTCMIVSRISQRGENW